MRNPYDDIINLPHHVSPKHPHMSMTGRAAQFSPFRAISGYEDAIQETGRLTDGRIELDEDEMAALDERLRLVLAWDGKPPQVSVTYFQPDTKKAGGAYVTVRGVIRKADGFEGVIFMADGTRISIREIIEIDSEIFDTVI